MSRRWTRVAFVLVSALALLLSACARRQPGGGEVQDPLGVIRIGPGEPITIGYMLTISGENETLGIDSRNGIEIAIDDKKEIKGHRIQLVGEDDTCSSEGGQAAAQKLASNPQVVAVIGPQCSSAARAALATLNQAGLTAVSPSATAPDLTAADRPPEYEAFLRTAPNDLVQGKVAAEFAWNVLKAKTAATIHDGSIYAEKLAKVFADNFRQLGGQVAHEAAITPQTTDMGPVLTTIARYRPDVIYLPIFLPAGGYVIKQAKQVAGLERTRLMGADGLFNVDLIKAAGPAARGVYLSSPDLTNLGPAYQEFLRKHQAKYGNQPPSVYHAHAYDAAMLIFHAIEQVAVQQPDGTLLIGKKALRDALYAIKDFQGLTGRLSCGVNDPSVPKFRGDCGDPKIAIYEIGAEQITDPQKNWPPRKVYP